MKSKYLYIEYPTLINGVNQQIRCKKTKVKPCHPY